MPYRLQLPQISQGNGYVASLKENAAAKMGFAHAIYGKSHSSFFISYFLCSTLLSAAPPEWHLVDRCHELPALWAGKWPHSGDLPTFFTVGWLSLCLVEREER